MSDGLAPELRLMIDEMEALNLPSMFDQSPEEARESFRALCRAMNGPGAETAESAVAMVREAKISGRGGPVPVRVYEPTGSSSDPLAVVVLMHGGGWVVGDLDTADPFARAIVACVGARVVSVHYRRAPEHPFPAAIHDCIDVVAAIGREPSTLSLSVAGDSVGGNLVAATALHYLDSGELAITAQLLLYPALDPRRRGGSAARFAEGYLLTIKDMISCDNAYLPVASDRSLPLAAPLRASNLIGMPPAIVVTAGFDPLLDEGREYALRLVAADVPTTYLMFPTLTHGWLEMVNSVPAAAIARRIVLETFGCLIRTRAAGWSTSPSVAITDESSHATIS